jgi:hypothetical protein
MTFALGVDRKSQLQSLKSATTRLQLELPPDRPSQSEDNFSMPLIAPTGKVLQENEKH